ncbi:MAG: mannonate dehydratase [Mycoplasmatales bacterium]
MQLSFRWYGHDDPVTLEYIKQIPNMKGIVSAIYDIEVGEEWPIERIKKLKEDIEKYDLELIVIESVPVHEDIKMGLGKRDYYIENYKKTIENLAKCGIKTICYNFMPVFDWTRSNLSYVNDDNSTSLIFNEEEVAKLDPKSLNLPGWDSSYSLDKMAELIDYYQALTHEQLWDNLKYFLDEIIPVAENCGVNMAIHPDDPPFDIFGIPRIITNYENLEKFINLYDSPNNGITFCTGSLGCIGSNDLLKMVNRFGKELNKIHFVHLRNVKNYGKTSFNEVAHVSHYGDINFHELLEVFISYGFEGAYRPDHGRMIWGETGRPGYGLYDRALGAMYLEGLIEAIKIKKEEKWIYIKKTFLIKQ